jgi:MYXO-CTERM domain-containing protein
MAVLNKRNAVLGWATWQVGKQAMKQKAKNATRVDSKRRPGKGTVAALLAAAGGAIVFLRRRREAEDE